MSVDYYALLGVPKFCSSQDEIRRAYLAQARFFHPDAGNVTPEIAHQKMQELNAIYDTLRDPDAKRLYDATVSRAIPSDLLRTRSKGISLHIYRTSVQRLFRVGRIPHYSCTSRNLFPF